MTARVYKALATVLLLGVAGCANTFHHRKVALAPALPPEPPELSQSPLYSPEMSESNPKLPSLPPVTMRQVAEAPQPAPQKPRKMRRKSTASTAKTNEADSATTTGTATSGEGAEQQPGAEKKAPDTQAHLAGEPAVSPIGELTAGDSASSAQTSRQAEDLIKNTQDGVDKIKRALSPDEKKTVAEIGAFLKKAEQALANGDVDGAYGLATKAKLLLDELTQR
jgi:hypothetical protein